MLRGRNIHYQGRDRLRGLATGGIGAMHLLARRTGLTAAIDESLQLLKVRQPYHESDHVLNLAYNLLCGGWTLEDLEQRRQGEVYLEALGARVIPDPTTAGGHGHEHDRPGRRHVGVADRGAHDDLVPGEPDGVRGGGGVGG